MFFKNSYQFVTFDCNISKRFLNITPVPRIGTDKGILGIWKMYLKKTESNFKKFDPIRISVLCVIIKIFFKLVLNKNV